MNVNGFERLDSDQIIIQERGEEKGKEKEEEKKEGEVSSG